MTQRADLTKPLFFLLAVPLLVIVLLPSGGATAEVGGTPWASPALEALDERHDAEIFEAVVQSMAQWQKRHEHKKYQREKRASESVVCYEGVGCFRDAGPFSYLDMLPSPPDEVSTHFLFYTRHQPHGPSLMVPFSNLTSVAYSVTSSVSTTSAATKTNARPVRDSPSEDSTSAPQKVSPSLSTSFSSPSSSDPVTSTTFSPGEWLKAGLNVSVPTKVIVHGFGSSCSNIWVFEMRSALMSVEECNVICVDWEAGATIPNYVRAAANTRLVGKQLALLLGRLRDSLGLDLQRVHLIGFSLGAHVAGFAGSELQNLSRITGLDPAGPLFENQDPAARLDSTDATFVDVIHSNGENLILGGLGSWQPMGHVDFYPNGGRMQKGCSNLFVGAVSDIFWSSTEAHGRSLCNHRRAYKFFTDSVSPRCHFPAISCESYERFLEGNCFPCSSQNRCGNMGYYADRSNGRGTLYLITRDDEPFCAHQYLVKVESTPSALPVVSYGKIQITILGASPDANETFTLTHKDDEELQAGGSLSRIVVPHPVMEEPVKVEVLYTAYSGWISSGLARWSIDKVTIGDSFGKSSSFCNKGLILDSGMPVTLPLYPGDCNPPHEPFYTPSLHLPMQPSMQIESTNSSPSKDNWSAAIATANNEEMKTSNKAEGSSSPYTQQTTRIPTQVVYAGDDGLEASMGADSTKKAEETTSSDADKMPDVTKEWENKNNNGTKSEVLSGTGEGQEDPFLNPPTLSVKEGLDDQDSSWQPFSNDSPSNSLSPDGAGSREDAARAFIDPGEVTNNIKKRNDSPEIPSEDPSDGRISNQSNSPSNIGPSATAITPQWRPRHIPMYSPSLYEPRGGWHPEMTPPELDPPPIHAPLTWHHWIGYNDKSLNEQRNAKGSNSSSITNSSDTETSTTLLVDEEPTSLPANATTTEKTERGPFAPVVETVQLLPQRLAAFLARAEEYARVTLSGMVMGVGGGNSPLTANDFGEGRRKPKYFPPMPLGTNADTSSMDEPHAGGPVAPLAVPSKASSVSAMGRGLPQYYPLAIVGQGKERSFDTESDVYAAREKSSQESKSILKVDRTTSDSKTVDVPLSDTGAIKAVIRPQRGIITTVSQRVLDVSVQGKDVQHWQKLDGAGDHHQPRYIPLRRLSAPRGSSRALQRRGPFVMPRRR